MKKQKGFSLVEVLVVVGIMAIVVAGISSIIINMQKETKQSSKKLEYMNAYILLLNTFQNPENCTCFLKDKQLDLTNPATASLSIPEIRASCAAGAPLLVRTPASTEDAFVQTYSQITAQDFVSTGERDVELANLVFAPEVTNGERILKEQKIALRLFMDPDSPISAKKIAGCGDFPIKTPLNVTVTPAQNKCELNWNIVPGTPPNTYVIKRSTTPGVHATGTVIGSATSNTYSDTGLTYGQTYYYAVRSQSDRGPSAYSDEVTCVVPSWIDLTISANTNNYNFFVAAGSPTVAANYRVTVNNGVTVGSTSTGIPAFTTGNAWPAGTQLEIVNNGTVIGRGGAGGGYPGTNGGTGGSALQIQYSANVINNGKIIGGGGGGGWGGGKHDASSDATHNATGGGAGGVALLVMADMTLENNGTIGGGGAGGAGGSSSALDGTSNGGGGGGGAGGGFGGNGNSWPYSNGYGQSAPAPGGTNGSATAPGSGGSGAVGGNNGGDGGNGTGLGTSGAATNGNSRINWTTTGTIQGALN